MLQTSLPIEEQLARLPDQPGVYKFYDAKAALLYVGKANSLRSRVRSYFLKTATLEPHKRQMVTEIADIQYLLAETPTQALHFEADLVRQERPRYNVKLRDDKHYPYIRVITGNDPRACLYYHIKRCPAPCIGAINNADYRQIVDQMVGFLDGKSDRVLADMRHEMEDAAEALEFERAADLRDRIRAAERVVTQQQIVYSSIDDEDVIGVHHEGPYSAVQVFLVRGGRLIGREHFVLDGHGEDSEAEIVWSFVVQYYSQSSDIPDEVVLPVAVDDVESIRIWLTDRRAETGSKSRKKVRVTAPRMGDKRKLIELATSNAREVLERLRQQWLADQARTTGAVVELQELLDLPQVPLRIECYDVSHVQGTNQVASMVVFENGQPRRSAYRRFKIKHELGSNDVLSMQEVIGRRFKRALTGQLRRAGELGSWESVEAAPVDGTSVDGAAAEQDAEPEGGWAEMPDLVIIDGGNGQGERGDLRPRPRHWSGAGRSGAPAAHISGAVPGPAHP